MSQINSVNPIAFKSYAVQSGNVTNPIDNKPREFNSEFYIDAKGAEALKSQFIPLNSTSNNKAVGLQNYIENLVNSGMVEGKDFEVYKNEDGANISLFDKNNRPIKFMYWDKGIAAENFGGYRDVEYFQDSDVSEIRTEYDKDGKIVVKEKVYKNAENHKDLFPQGIDMNTTAKEYIKTLNDKNANFEIHENENSETGKYSFIVESDKDGVPEKMTSFSEYNDGMRFINQSYGKRDTSIMVDGNYSELSVADFNC